MGQNSGIQWTTHTFNPWRGCTKVSDGCKFCYADKLSKRNPGALGVWGPNGERVVGTDAYWRQPVAWDKAAANVGERHRVFCASLADVFEGPETMPAKAVPVITAARRRLFDLVCRTPNLDWLLLTKRPQNALPMMVEAGLYAVANPDLPCPQPNIWIGTSVENQEAADERIPHLLQVPAVVRFLSCEPLLGAVDISRYIWLVGASTAGPFRDVLGRVRIRGGGIGGQGFTSKPSRDIHWCIVGCESSGKAAGRFAREYETAARDILEQCAPAGVAAFHKQMPIDGKVSGEPDEWPEDLRMRQLPPANEAVQRLFGVA